jgi:hypothetical protein
VRVFEPASGYVFIFSLCKRFFAVLSILATASPTDVRRGYGPPSFLLESRRVENQASA